MRIQIIDINTINEETYRYWLSLVAYSKRQRIERLRRMQDRYLSVAGEMLAKKMMSEYVGDLKPEQVILETGPNQKPIAANVPLCFNISHSGTKVICAVSKRPIGVDIERIEEFPLEEAEGIFSREEMDYVISGVSPLARFMACPGTVAERLYEVWTKKEAYLKCIGIGITNGVEIRLEEIVEEMNIYSEIHDGYIYSVARWMNTVNCMP